MAVTCGFFNSKSGDRKYNAEQMSMYFDKLITSGVFPNPSTQLQVVIGGGMTVNVLPGRGLINCRWVNNDANCPLTIDASDVSLDRIDAVIMKLDLTEDVRDIHFEVKKGTPSSNPVAPSMTRTEYIQEYCLATITVKKLATEITQAEIKDMRPNTAVCGWVTHLIDQVDTSTLFAQWESAYQQFYDGSNDTFNTWFQHLQETVSGGAVLKAYAKTYVTSEDAESEIPIGIEEYARETDIFCAYINGMKLIPETDFSIDTMGTTMTLVQPVDVGTVIRMEVLKNTDETGG